jgi:hypothetical protein
MRQEKSFDGRQKARPDRPDLGQTYPAYPATFTLNLWIGAFGATPRDSPPPMR